MSLSTSQTSRATPGMLPANPHPRGATIAIFLIPRLHGFLTRQSTVSRRSKHDNSGENTAAEMRKIVLQVSDVGELHATRMEGKVRR